MTTSLRIAAASARALPARAAHLSGWTHWLRRSAPAPAPSNRTQHTSYVAQYPVTLQALSLTTSLLDSLPGAKIVIVIAPDIRDFGLSEFSDTTVTNTHAVE
jgi:hypothetical protein